MEYVPVETIMSYAGVHDANAVSRAARLLNISPAIELAPNHWAYEWDAKDRLIAALRDGDIRPVEPPALFDVEPATAQPAPKKRRTRNKPPAAPSDAQAEPVPALEPAPFVPPIDPGVETEEFMQLPRLRLVEFCGHAQIRVSARATRRTMARALVDWLNDQRAQGLPVQTAEWFTKVPNGASTRPEFSDAADGQ